MPKDHWKTHTFITWERIAVTLIAILIALISFTGRGIVTEVEAMRKTMGNLNDTLYAIKLETALATQNTALTSKRLEEMGLRLYDLESRVRLNSLDIVKDDVKDVVKDAIKDGHGKVK